MTRQRYSLDQDLSVFEQNFYTVVKNPTSKYYNVYFNPTLSVIDTSFILRPDLIASNNLCPFADCTNTKEVPLSSNISGQTVSTPQKSATVKSEQRCSVLNEQE